MNAKAVRLTSAGLGGFVAPALAPRPARTREAAEAGASGCVYCPSCGRCTTCDPARVVGRVHECDGRPPEAA